MVNNDSMLMPTRWQTYIGIMTESTTFKNQRWFGVYIPEFMPKHAGDVQPDYKEEDVNLGNVWTGKPTPDESKARNILNPTSIDTKVKVTKTVRADYWGWNPSEDVPTMYRDMQVLVINFANLDRWYWIPLERDRSYKTFEHIRFSANNVAVTNKTKYQSKDNDDKTDVYVRNTALGNDGNEDKETTYYLEIDTRYKKHVKIHTNHSDGELFDYTFEIDPQKHTIEIHDKCVDKSQPNNTIILESKPDSETKGRIKLQTAGGATFLLNGEDMSISVPRNLKIDVGGDFFKRVRGNEMNSAWKDSHDLIFGNYVKTVDGETQLKYRKSVAEGIAENKLVNIVGSHQEKQYSRQTISNYASWESVKTWNVGTESTTMKAKTFSLDSNSATLTLKSLTVYAKNVYCILGSLTGTVITRMLLYIPYHISIPMIPFITHTLIF